MAFAFLKGFFAPPPPPPLDRLWQGVVTAARRPEWYREGGVPDTLDGRFDMVALMLSLVLVRLEAVDDAESQVLLTERFVDDMDGNLRQSGIGEMVVGKHVGKMMGALGGRLGAYREALDGGDLEGALERNLYRGAPPSSASIAWAASEVRRRAAAIDAMPLAQLLDGKLPE